MRFFSTQVYDFVYDSFVVGIVVTVGTHHVAFDNFFAQVAARRIRYERYPAGFLHRNHVSFAAHASGIVGHRGFNVFRQSV